MAKREWPSKRDQQLAHGLRNELCCQYSAGQMAGTASHLRGYAVAECIALIGRLDSHPKIDGSPTVSKSGALAQSIQGTVKNPLAHAMPASFLINKNNPKEFFDSAEAQQFVARVLGMGVIAPDDWSATRRRRLPVIGGSVWQSDVDPVQVNRTHIGVEGYQRKIQSDEEDSRGSLVHAMVQTLGQAAKLGTFNATGSDQFNNSALLDFVKDVYKKVWRPLALVAYDTAREKLREKHRRASGARRAVIDARLKILAEDSRTFRSDSPCLSEATRMVIKATAGESWRLLGTL